MPQLSNTRSIRLGDLFSDPEYQRDLDIARVERYAKAGFDKQLFQPLVVSRRQDGTLAVVDGAHRQALVKMLGWGPYDLIPCVVVSGLTGAQEASLFVQLQRKRTNLLSYDLFKGDLASGDPEAVGLQVVLAGRGLRAVSKNSAAPDGMRAIGAARATFRHNGAGLLDDVLQVGLTSWPHDLIHGLSAPTIDALTAFIVTHASRGVVVDIPRLIKVCSKIPAAGFASTKQSGEASYKTAAAALVQPYNRLARRTPDRLEILPVNVYTKRPRRPDMTNEAELEETA